VAGRRALIYWLLVLFLAACGGEPTYTRQDEQYRITFADGDTWGGPRSGFDGASFTLDDAGNFRIGNTTEAYAWALLDDDHTDTLIETRPRLTTDNPNNGYGIGCRMDDSGAGYYFLVSRDGYHAILKATSQSLTNLTQWRFSNTIQTGVTARNTIEATCIGTTLMLTVNGERLASATDSTHTSGSSGLIVSGSVVGVTNVAFDGVAGWDVTLD
jgi:hypothetical protein